MGKGKEHKEHTWNLIAKKLAGEASPEELRELEKLLRDNPDLHYPMQTIADIWEHSAAHDPKKIEKAFNEHLGRMERLNTDYTILAEEDFPPKKNARKKILLLTPILAGLLIASIWYLQRPAPAQLHEVAAATVPAKDISTRNGSRTHLSLPDGTSVWLNAGSHIQYGKTFGATTREIILSGEAFFDVAPNAGKPFIIHTKKVNIRVLGTSFDVKSYPTDKTTEATLIRGSIEVSIENRPDNKIILKPNEKLVISNEDSLQTPVTPRHKDSTPQSLVVISKPTYDERSGAVIETSWIDNKLIFQDEAFGDLAKQLDRKYGVDIVFENSRLQQLEFTGIFEKESIRQALDALKLTARFDYTIEKQKDEEKITIH